MDVDGDLVLLSQPEDDVEVPGGVAVQAARIDAAHDVCAGLQRLFHQRNGAFLAQQAGLREGDDLDVGPVPELVLGRRDGVETLQAAVHIDLGVGTDTGGAPRDHAAERVVDAFLQRDFGVAPVQPVVHHHGPHARPARVLAERQPDAGGVQMDVDVGEGRHQQPAAAFDDGRASRRPGESVASGVCGSTAAILPSCNEDIAQRLSPRPDGADQGGQRQCLSRRRRDSRPRSHRRRTGIPRSPRPGSSAAPCPGSA